MLFGRNEKCLCGTMLTNVRSPVWKCPKCDRVYELAEIVTDITHRVCSGIGLVNKRKRRRK